MPSQRKRIGFLPSEEVHEIIDKLCKANEFSQSKVTGLLVEEALRSRGVLSDVFQDKSCKMSNFINNSFGQESVSRNDKSLVNRDDCMVNKKTLSADIKLMHEFIEFKYFKKIMNQNYDILINRCHTFYN